MTCSNNQNPVTVFSRKAAFGCFMNRHSLCVMLVDFCREKAEHLELQGKLNHTSELEISVLNLHVVSVRCYVCFLLLDLKPKDEARSCSCATGQYCRFLC